MTVCMSACSPNETEATPVTETPIVSGYSGDLSEYDFDHLSLLIPINRVKAEIEENCVN